MSKDTTLVEKLVKARSEGKEETLQRLAREINECYGKPFLPEGFVRARVTDYGTLWLDIGDRNGEFDKQGNRVGSSVNVGEGREWTIEKGLKPALPIELKAVTVKEARRVIARRDRGRATQ